MRSLVTLTGGVLLYQAAFIASLLVTQATMTVEQVSQIVLFLSLSQLLGAVAPLQLQNEMIKTADDGLAAREFSTQMVFVLLVAVVVAAGALGLGFGSHLAWQAGLGMLVFAWSDILRASFIRAERKGWQAAPHLILAAGFTGGIVSVLSHADPDLFIAVFCGVSLVGLVLASPWRARASLACFIQLIRKGWRFAIYRTPTTAIDVLLTRSLVLFMTPLGEAFVNAFFLVMRLLLGPLQMVIWAASYVIYKRSLGVERKELQRFVARTWDICLLASIGLVWCLTAIVSYNTAFVSEYLNFAPSVPLLWLTLVVLVIVVSQAYIGWLGRIFDIYNEQRNIVFYEIFSKVVIISSVYVACIYGDGIDFLITYSILYILFTAGFIMMFCRMMHMRVGRVVLQYGFGTIGLGILGAMLVAVS